MGRPWSKPARPHRATIIVMSGILTELERATALQHLETSATHYEQVVSVVPEELWKVKPDENVWSPAEAAEHIVVTERAITQLIAMRLPHSAERALTDEVRRVDAMIVPRVSSAATAFQAPDFLRPTNCFPDRASCLKAFLEVRSALIEFVHTCQVPLRKNVVPHPALGDLDGYQWILLAAAHCIRHTRQVEQTVTALKNRPA